MCHGGFQSGVPIFGGRPGLRLGCSDAAMSRPSAASIRSEKPPFRRLFAYFSYSPTALGMFYYSLPAKGGASRRQRQSCGCVLQPRHALGARASCPRCRLGARASCLRKWGVRRPAAPMPMLGPAGRARQAGPAGRARQAGPSGRARPAGRARQARLAGLARLAPFPPVSPVPPVPLVLQSLPSLFFV